VTRDGVVSVPPEKQSQWQGSRTSWDSSTWRGGSWACNTPFQAGVKEPSTDNEDTMKDGVLLGNAAAPGWERSAEEASTTLSHGNSDVAELVTEGVGGQPTHAEGQLSETDSVVASLPTDCQKLQELESELLEERRCREKVEAELKEERLHSKQLEAQLTEERCRREELERRLAENGTGHPEVSREVVTDADHSASWNAVVPSSPEIPPQTHSQESVKDEHPHQKEEWYQKWLRRQETKGRQVVEIGQPPDAEDVQISKGADHENEPSVTHQNVDSSEKRVCPDDGKKYTFEELQAAFGKEYTAEDLKSYWRDAMKVEGAEVAPPEPATKGYEHEEWYQKWLRRQKNKSRQIIEIG